MIDALIALMVPAMRAELAALRVDVKEHAGKFTWDELQARSYRAPALFVSCLGWRELRDEEATRLGLPLDAVAPARVRFAAGIVTKHSKSAEDRNIEARLICQKLSILIDRNDWDQALVGQTQDMQVEGLFAPAAEADNQSLWLLTWWHPVAMDRETLAASLDAFITARGDHYAAPGEHTDALGNDIPLVSNQQTLPQP